MFLKFILIFLTISINESFSLVKFDQQTNHSNVINHAMISIKCGLKCLLQCSSIGNQNPNYGCLDSCFINCQWEKPAKKDHGDVFSSLQTDELEHLLNEGCTHLFEM